MSVGFLLFYIFVSVLIFVVVSSWVVEDYTKSDFYKVHLRASRTPGLVNILSSVLCCCTLHMSVYAMYWFYC